MSKGVKQPVVNIVKSQPNIKLLYKINTQKNKQINAQLNKHSDNETPEPNEKPLCCYNKESKDMRCCGLCYTFCYNPNKDNQCYVCPETFKIYYKSGYFTTIDGSQTGEECENCLCTVLCLPIKIPIFFPCLLGSLFNNAINYCRNTETNYLC